MHTLQTTEKIYDSVHGFIHFNALESALIDSMPFQRLHYIRQLGIAYLVYPGATHTRFEHSLGVMELASQIYDQIINKYIPPLAPEERSYWRQIIRFAALCHDLGHLPFSHVAEQAVLGNAGHEKWSLEVIRSDFLREIWGVFEKQFPGKKVVDDIIKLAIGEKKLIEWGHPQFSHWEKVLCQIISGDFFGADRIDYLIRDAQCTGVSHGLFDYHQLIESLHILPSVENPETLELGVEENGIEACEAMLLARHFMHRRVYKYHSVKAYSFHMSRFMHWLYTDNKGLYTLDSYLSYSDNEVLAEIKAALRDKKHPMHQEAACIMVRHRRFKAMELPDKIALETINMIKKQLHIPEVAIGIECAHGTAKSSPSLAFLVKARHGSIGRASRFSEVAIPSGARNWVFLEGEYVPHFLAALEKQL